MEPTVGFEPTTYALRVRRSTTELCRLAEYIIPSPVAVMQAFKAESSPLRRRELALVRKLSSE